MASKISTDDPRHHKYVSVNKRERKKRPRRPVKILSLLFPRWMFEPCCHNWHWLGAPSHFFKKGSVIVWDDCNHKSFRYMEKRKGGRGKAFRCDYSRYRVYPFGDFIYLKGFDPVHYKRKCLW